MTSSRLGEDKITWLVRLWNEELTTKLFDEGDTADAIVHTGDTASQVVLIPG